jgi:hypothetical protein
LVDWSIGRLVDWSIGRLVDWSAESVKNGMVADQRPRLVITSAS